MRALIATALTALITACAHVAPAPQTPGEIAAALAEGRMEPGAIDLAAWRDARPDDLAALHDALPCDSAATCMLGVEAGWALAAPDGNVFAAELARLRPHIDALRDGVADLDALAASASDAQFASQYRERLDAAAAVEDPVIAELLRREARDQYTQLAYREIFDGVALTQDDGDKLGEIHGALTGLEFRANTAWLKTVVAERGWFTVSRDGAAATNAAWLMAQHADDDPAWQREVLALMEPLARAGEADRGDYAYLFDRVAVNAGELQRYGTQGGCRDGGAGGWEPRPVEPPADELDARRAEMGLEPEADYIAGFAAFGFCQAR